ncbi:MAG TPA: TonB-dependent receptor [Azospirillaceae bacterium]|nr:TonB-dependent receptor [Azospirillaceae bacterium]
MTHRQDSVARALKLALLTGAAAMLFTSGTASAQSAQQTTPSTQTGTQGTPTTGTSEDPLEVVVVGSRLRRDTFNSPSPIQLVTREETTAAGLASAAEILQGSGVTGGSAQINNAFGGFVTDGGPGANTISLRGLGAGRTLVLINGRRVAPAGTRGAVGSADLNVLPNAIIERVEILRDGASSIYGSDAIAGVVNVITDTAIDGITVEGQYNRPTRGQGEQGRASVVAGTSGERWKVAGSLEYYERGNLTLADRDWTRCNTDYRFDPVTGQQIDFIDPLTNQPKCYPITGTGSNGVTINTIGTATTAGVGAPGSVGTSFNRWRPNAAVTTGLVGFEGVGGGLNNINVRDTFDPRTLNRNIISPAQVLTGFGQASYQLDALGNAEAYVELLGTQRDSQQTGYRQLSLDYPRFSPLIPANLQAGQFLPAGGTTLFPGPTGVRAFIGFGNDESEQNVEFYKATGGLRGDLGFLADWRYDANVTHSMSDAKYRSQSFLTNRLGETLDVVAAPAGFNPALVRRAADGSSVTCRVNTTNAAAGCIPAPVLNSQTIGGQLPTDWSNYVFRDIVGDTEYTETQFAGSIDGPLFSLPAGKVQGAFGAEYREAEIDDTPPLDSQNGNLLNLTSATPTRGKDSVMEAFGEVEVPVFADLPFIHELTVNGSARYTDYESYGADWTYKVGGLFSPVEWLSLRSSYGTSYRAPALFEQFQGATSGFLSQQNDPCNNYGAPSVNPNRARNCAQELPGQPTFQATQGIATFSQGGAGSGLKAETSENLTLGAILAPELPEGWGEIAFAVDYFDIQIDNGVDQVGTVNILTRCYDDPEFRAGGGLCRLVTRAPVTNQLTVINAYTNVATAITRGFDYSARWTGDIGPANLRLNANVTKYNAQKTRIFSDEPFDEFNGIIGAPEWVGTFDATVGYEEWKVRYGLEWHSASESYDYFGFTQGVDPYIFGTDAYFLHRASVQYTTEAWSATLGVRNIFDKEPPQISSGGLSQRIGNAPLYSGYDYVGRQVFLNLRLSF